MMEKFLELWKESSIVQGLITLIILVTICVMYWQGQEVPDTLTGIIMVIVGYYFGTKSQQLVTKSQAQTKGK